MLILYRNQYQIVLSIMTSFSNGLKSEEGSTPWRVKVTRLNVNKLIASVLDAITSQVE